MATCECGTWSGRRECGLTCGRGKAVADGAVSLFVSRLASAGVAGMTQDNRAGAQSWGRGKQRQPSVHDEITIFGQSYNALQQGLTQAVAGLQEKQNDQLKMMQGVLQHAEATARELRALREEHANTKQQQAMQDMEMQAIQRQVEAKTQELQQLRAEQASTKELLETQTAELATARQFLSQTDPVSEEEVVQMVETLNTDILHTAATLSESLPHTTRLLAETSYDKSRASRTHLSGADGAIRQFVYNSRNTPNPSLALQIALQAYLTTCCTRIVGYWHPDELLNSVFDDLYEGMRQASEQLSCFFSTAFPS